MPRITVYPSQDEPFLLPGWKQPGKSTCHQVGNLFSGTASVAGNLEKEK